MDSIQFQATISSVGSARDGGIKIVLNSPDLEAGAKLMQLLATPTVFQVALVPEPGPEFP